MRLTHEQWTRVREFFRYASERYIVHLKKSHGWCRPWTSNEILRKYRFCNIFREHDHDTMWLRRLTHQMQDTGYGHEHMLWVCTLFRFTGRTEVCDTMLEQFISWSPQDFADTLSQHDPMITGAYMIKTPVGRPKIDGLIEILDPVWENRRDLTQRIHQRPTLEHAHEIITSMPWIGGFMGYEIVTDLSHTGLLKDAPDVLTWAHAGPGAHRGASRILLGSPDSMKSDRESQTQVMDLMRELVSIANEARPSLWLEEWPRWTMREAEHTLCEFDKYMRAVTGVGRPKQLYTPRGEKH